MIMLGEMSKPPILCDLENSFFNVKSNGFIGDVLFYSVQQYSDWQRAAHRAMSGFLENK